MNRSKLASLTLIVPLITAIGCSKTVDSLKSTTLATEKCIEEVLNCKDGEAKINLSDSGDTYNVQCNDWVASVSSRNYLGSPEWSMGCEERLGVGYSVLVIQNSDIDYFLKVRSHKSRKVLKRIGDIDYKVTWDIDTEKVDCRPHTIGDISMYLDRHKYDDHYDCFILTNVFNIKTNSDEIEIYSEKIQRQSRYAINRTKILLERVKDTHPSDEI